MSMHTFRKTPFKLCRNTCKGVQLLLHKAGICVGITMQKELLYVHPLITSPRTHTAYALPEQTLGNHEIVSSTPQPPAQQIVPICKHKQLCSETAARQHQYTVTSQANAAANAHFLSAALIGRSPLYVLKQCRQVWEGELVVAPPLL